MSTACVPWTQASEGSATDKLRLVLVWLLTTEHLPGDADMNRLQSSLATAGADTTAVAYLRRMRSMKLTGKSPCNLEPAGGCHSIYYPQHSASLA